MKVGAGGTARAGHVAKRTLQDGYCIKCQGIIQWHELAKRVFKRKAFSCLAKKNHAKRKQPNSESCRKLDEILEMVGVLHAQVLIIKPDKVQISGL
jgi:hypothetical protein